MWVVQIWVLGKVRKCKFVQVSIWLSVLCNFSFAPAVPAATGLSVPNFHLKLKYSPPDHCVSMSLLVVLVVAVTLSHVEGNPECNQAREMAAACQARLYSLND